MGGVGSRVCGGYSFNMQYLPSQVLLIGLFLLTLEIHSSTAVLGNKSILRIQAQNTCPFFGKRLFLRPYTLFQYKSMGYRSSCSGAESIEHVQLPKQRATKRFSVAICSIILGCSSRRIRRGFPTTFPLDFMHTYLQKDIDIPYYCIPYYCIPYYCIPYYDIPYYCTPFILIHEDATMRGLLIAAEAIKAVNCSSAEHGVAFIY